MSNRGTAQSLMLAVALALATAHVAPAAAPLAVDLMRMHNCYTCHADARPLAGPAFADVASAYRDNPDAVAIAATIIRTGTRGAGPCHMPPHPTMSAREARLIARYIVELDPRSRSEHVEAKASFRS